MSDANHVQFTPHEWQTMRKVGNARWKCGYRDHFVSSEMGYHTSGSDAFARACPNCKGLSMFVKGVVTPRPTPGSPVTGVDPMIDEDEARHLFPAPDIDANRVAVGNADQRCLLRCAGNLVRPQSRSDAVWQLLAGEAVAIRVEGGIARRVSVVDRLRPDLTVVIGAVDDLLAGGLPEYE
jgi:hypothetical protein